MFPLPQRHRSPSQFDAAAEFIGALGVARALGLQAGKVVFHVAQVVAQLHDLCKLAGACVALTQMVTQDLQILGERGGMLGGREHVPARKGSRQGRHVGERVRQRRRRPDRVRKDTSHDAR